MSGLGELPDHAASARPALVTETVDVLVVGAGIAGLALATALRARGRSVLLCDDRGAPGGGARGLGAFDVDRHAGSIGEALRLRTTAIGVLEGGDWLLASGDGGLVRVVARAHAIATGAHDATPEFKANDLPGVISARAALALLEDGVLVGSAPIVVGDGMHAQAFQRAATAEGSEVTVVHSVLGARGLSQVKGALAVRVAGGPEEKIDGDAIVHDAPPAPSFELAVQAGAVVRHGPAGFAVVVDEVGRVRLEVPTTHPRALFALGEVTGAALDPVGFVERAAIVADAIQRGFDR